jgi:hypothetical protein
MKKLILIFFILVLNLNANDNLNQNDELQINTTTITTSSQWELKQRKITISGIVLTPTAYRSNGVNEIGPSLDFNAAYYIGRLYGKNDFSWTVDKKNYLDRVGIWFFEMDGKLLIQRETKNFPAVSSGYKGMFAFRDSPQPSLNQPQATIKVKNSDTYSTLYIVLSKNILSNLFINAGYSDGDFSKFIYQTSEFLSDTAIKLTTQMNKPYISKSTLFAGILYLYKEKTPLGFEIIIPQGSTLSPKLINFQLGNFLKLNFQISYLKYKYGYEYLGMFNFRYSFYPRIKKQK